MPSAATIGRRPRPTTMDLHDLEHPRRARRAAVPRPPGVGVGGARRERLRADDRPAGGAARAARRASCRSRSPARRSARRVSRDGTVKALFATADGRPLEAVLMRYRDGRRSLCLSSQSGCPLTCRFCATGAMRFGRNLTTLGDPRPGAPLPPHRSGRPLRLHGHGRADAEPRRGARRLRAAAGHRHLAPPHDDLHRRLDPRASSGWPRARCRCGSRSRCTRPRKRCAPS